MNTSGVAAGRISQRATPRVVPELIDSDSLLAWWLNISQRRSPLTLPQRIESQWQIEATMSSSTLTQKYALAYPFVTANTDHFQGEDLGRTDLQEDGLEFHNSSTTTSSHIQNHHLTNHRLCIAIRPFSPRQAPTKQLLLPPHRFINIQHPQLKQQALPLDALLLRPILRRRYLRSRPSLSRRHLPTLKLPGCPRWKPRSVRSFLDRYHCRGYPLPHGHHFAILGKGRKETLHAYDPL